ncbi:menaquinone biosynthetic enzyme MqnA/MqnD family protein [Zavarzinella formosa]|uniref:menaquinone biosynthetic enzyme MqnA/MqnD family protein n=1 Tax=Zavarzinella formosa TaxID=360055 RepID=UPI000495E5EB|nr:menaquinone biosynthesis protein [Zavarzinella formosa]
MPAKVRVGAVNYLNTKPLIEDLTTFAPNADLRLDLPSRLADQMRDGQLDVALIPVIEYFRAGDYTHVPGVSIASRGPVLSVTLFSRVPWEQIQSVALDEGSRTSAALTKVLLHHKHGLRPRTVQLPIEVAADDMTTDAVLLIGDRAMQSCLPGFTYAYDLGQEWFDWTGLPFVFAVWAVRPGVDLRGVDAGLRQARDHGLQRAGHIAWREAPGLQLDAGMCRRYLSNILSFDLGEAELAGLRRFYQLACELDLAPEGVELREYAAPLVAA